MGLKLVFGIALLLIGGLLFVTSLVSLYIGMYSDDGINYEGTFRAFAIIISMLGGGLFLIVRHRRDQKKESENS